MRNNFMLLVLVMTMFFSHLAFAEMVKVEPNLPKTNEALTITLNTKQCDCNLSDYTDTIYAHTGLITSKSGGSSSDWKYVLSDWGENTAETMLEKVNDSIYTFTIDTDVKTYYGVSDPGEAVYRIAILFRNKEANKQTSDMMINVVSPAEMAIVKEPMYPTSNSLIGVTFNAKMCDCGLSDYNDSLYVHNGVITNYSNNAASGWRYDTKWGENLKESMADQLDDSTYRFYVPKVYDFYEVEADTENIIRVAMLFRSKAADKQTSDFHVEVYDRTPDTLLFSQPAVPSSKLASATTVNLKKSTGLKDYSDTLYAHTGLITTKSTDDNDWKYDLNDWGVNESNARLVQVSDSVYRYFVFPSVRKFYEVDDMDVPIKMAFVFRNKDANGQTANLYVELEEEDEPEEPEVPISIWSANDDGTFSIYPNPASSEFVISSAENRFSQAKLTLFNTYGQKIFEGMVSLGSAISLSDMDVNPNTQMLIYQVEMGDKISQGKLLIK